MEAAIICRELGWTFDEYLATPQPFIDCLWDMFQEETKARNRQQESQARIKTFLVLAGSACEYSVAASAIIKL
jgi:hypothetical protein